MAPDWTVDEAQAGERLDRFLADRLTIPRNQAHRLIKDGLVSVAGKKGKPSTALHQGQPVHCRELPEPEESPVVAEDGALEVLYKDTQLLVVNKPAGLAVHPGAGRPSGTLVNRVLSAFPEVSVVGGASRPGVVHRIDMDTTGVLVLARTQDAYQALSAGFAGRTIDKTYLAVCYGRTRADEERIEAPIGRHRTKRKQMTVRPDGRPARTDYRLLAEADTASLLELNLHTGRTHQIRVHLQHKGHPLVGDETYAGNRWRSVPKRRQPVLRAFSRPALHAWRIGFDHPHTGKPVSFEAPPASDIAHLWTAISGQEFQV